MVQILSDTVMCKKHLYGVREEVIKQLFSFNTLFPKSDLHSSVRRASELSEYPVYEPDRNFRN